ncbi:hypothetical protein WN943_004306 [Citrus x changshan-huyou]
MEDAVPEAESLLHRQEECSKRKETDAEGKDDEERKGGLLDHIIHNLVSPLSPRAGDVNQKKDEVFGSKDIGARSENEGSGSEEEVGNVNSGGGGLIKNVIPNFFRPSEQAQVTENEKKNEEVKKDDEGGGGGGSIIGNIVSHLPTSLPGDVAPTTDEASILIHSIIHD